MRSQVTVVPTAAEYLASYRNLNATIERKDDEIVEPPQSPRNDPTPPASSDDEDSLPGATIRINDNNGVIEVVVEPRDEDEDDFEEYEPNDSLDEELAEQQAVSSTDDSSEEVIRKYQTPVRHDLGDVLTLTDHSGYSECEMRNEDNPSEDDIILVSKKKYMCVKKSDYDTRRDATLHGLHLCRICTLWYVNVPICLACYMSKVKPSRPPGPPKKTKKKEKLKSKHKPTPLITLPLSNVTDTPMCTVCFEQPINAGFVHGKLTHRCVCYTCGKVLVKRKSPCPICRRQVERVTLIIDS